MFKKSLVFGKFTVLKQFYSKRMSVNFDIKDAIPKEIAEKVEITKNEFMENVELKPKDVMKYVEIEPKQRVTSFASNQMEKMIKIRKVLPPVQNRGAGVLKKMFLFTLKCGIAVGVVYGSNEIGIWGPAVDLATLMKNVEEFFTQNSQKLIEDFETKT